jgi:hypothetical protein
MTRGAKLICAAFLYASGEGRLAEVRFAVKS